MHPPPQVASQVASAEGNLSEYGLLEFVGSDAAEFLQGYVTSDTAVILQQQGAPTAFCNLKGRVVANGWLWGVKNNLKCVVHKTCIETLASFLKPYLNFSKTELVIASRPLSGRIVGDSDANAAAAAVQNFQAAGEIVRLDANRFLGLGNAESNHSGNVPDIAQAWLRYSIDALEVSVTAATANSFLPQMLGLTEFGAVSFSKGCYLGQEVVARAEHRGRVKRKLRRARIDAAISLSAGRVLKNAAGQTQATVINAVGGVALIVTNATSPRLNLHADNEAVNLDLY